MAFGVSHQLLCHWPRSTHPFAWCLSNQQMLLLGDKMCTGFKARVHILLSDIKRYQAHMCISDTGFFWQIHCTCLPARRYISLLGGTSGYYSSMKSCILCGYCCGTKACILCWVLWEYKVLYSLWAGIVAVQSPVCFVGIAEVWTPVYFRVQSLVQILTAYAEVLVANCTWGLFDGFHPIVASWTSWSMVLISKVKSIASSWSQKQVV